MKMAAVFVLVAFALVQVQAETTNPISKVLELLTNLEAKITSEGVEAKKLYEEYMEFCEDRSKELGYDIGTGKQEVADLEAEIAKETADIEALGSKIDELGSSIAEAEAELKNATSVRTSEAKDFAAEEKELLDTLSALERAIAILEREAGTASFAQMQSAGNNIVQALSAMVTASALSTADASRLTALVQSSSDGQDEDEDSEFGAPDAAVYKSHTGTIIETLESLQQKGEAQLDELRKTETNAIHAFEMLKQSLEDQIKFATKDMEEAKKALAEAGEEKATAMGDLETTSNDLAQDEKSLAELKNDCMNKATDYEAEVKSRGEELKALAEAKKVISEMTPGAEDLAYGLSQVSLLQLSSSATSPGFDAVRFVKHLAQKHGSTELAQLSSRMASALRLGAGVGDDPFAKVKGLITEMIARLESEAASDATMKAYCDKEMAEATAKKEELTAEVEKKTAKMEQMEAESAKLKAEVTTLQKELAELAMTQAEMDKLRAEEKATFDENAPQMEAGIQGCKLALKILNEYYAKEDKDHGAAEGAGSGIIGLLEVAESDFSKMYAEMKVNEASAAAAYEKQTKENEVTKVTKERDVKYKTQEAAALDKAVAEIKSDLEGLHTELEAVFQELEKLTDMCVAKPETYEERKAKREAELAGLKEALTILETEAAFLQKHSQRRTLRGHAKLQA